MLDFIDSIPDILLSEAVYHPDITTPGKTIVLKKGKKSCKAEFFRCEMKRDGDFVLHSLTFKEATTKHYIYLPDNQNLALILNLQDVSSENLKDIRSCLVETTATMLKDSRYLDSSHPLRKFGDIILGMDDASLLKFVNTLLRKVNDHLEKNVDKKEKRTVLERLSAVKIIFDIHPVGNGQKIHEVESYRDWSNALEKKDLSSNAPIIKDVFGNTGPTSTDTWPEIKIHKFGRFALFRKNEKVRCFSAYGFNSLDTQPVTVHTFSKLNKATRQITSEAYYKKTWDCFEFAGYSHLMILVPVRFNSEETIQVIEHPNVLDICGFADKSAFRPLEDSKPGDNTVIDSKHGYLDLGSQVMRNLRAQALKTPNAVFKILLMRKCSDGTFLTLLKKDMDIEKLANATGKWVEACENATRNPCYLTVADAWISLNREWTVGAGVDSSDSQIKHYKDKIEKNSFSYDDILRLFLEDDKEVARRAIEAFGWYHCNLLADVAKRYHSKQTTVATGIREDYYKLFALASIILSKRGITVNSIKEQQPYLMGLCVGIIDRFHKEMCDVERRGKYPRGLFFGSDAVSSFLAGNSLVAWNQLIQSTFFLTHWAKMASFNGVEKKPEDKEFGVVENYRWYRSCIEKIAEAGLPPTSFTPEQRAMFTLGFASV